MQEFEYQENISQITNCPPSNYEEVNLISYRWIYEQLTNPKNFVPRYFSRPPKYNWKDDEEKCKDLAISLFDTCENAVNRFKFFFKTMDIKAYQYLGSKVAECIIKPTDGLSGVCDKDKYGHYNFHPYKGSNLFNNAKIVHEL
jgi:hypothetical protein